MKNSKKKKPLLRVFLLTITFGLAGIFLYALSPAKSTNKYNTESFATLSYRSNRKDTNIQKKIKNYEERCLTQPNFSCYQNDLTTQEKLLAELTVERKIKQLVGPLYTPQMLKNLSISKNDFGFYALIKTTSYNSANQIHNNITDHLDTDQDIPPFIGLDAEGGVVKRLSWHKITHLSEITDLAEADFCKKIEPDIKALKKSGFNWTLAPVVDKPYSSKDWIYPRAISINQDKIIRTAEKYVQCMRERKMLTTLKHFPGHGDSVIDSHKSIPLIDHNIDQWGKNEGQIFRTLIEEDKADTILIGHLRYPLISQEISSMSNRWQQEILQNELKYEGLIISDDVFMLNESVNQPCEKLAWEAVEAGTHVVLFVENSKCSGEEIVNYFVKKYEESDTNKAIINKRAGDVLEFKKEWFQNF